MPGLRSSRFQRSSVRHRSSWEFGPETSGNGGPQELASQNSAQLAGTAVQPTEDGQTLIRTRGEILMYLKTAGSAGDGFHGAFGIAKVTAAAFTAGAAAVPTPLTEEAWDGWLYHRYFSLLSPSPIAVATARQQANSDIGTVLRIEIDSKAMRKFDVNESFMGVIENVVHGVATMEWAFNCRMLFKLMA